MNFGKLCIVVGGDHRYLRTIFDVLNTEYGFKVIHDDGKKRKRHLRCTISIPKEVKLIIAITNFGAHNIINNYKALADKLGIPVLYTSKSIGDLKAKLEHFHEADLC